jgi:hypothetical protein
MDTLTKSQRMRAYAKKAKRMAEAHKRPKRHRFVLAQTADMAIGTGCYIVECADCGCTERRSLWSALDYPNPVDSVQCKPSPCLHLRAMWRRENNGQRFLVACADCKEVAVLAEKAEDMSAGEICTTMARNLRRFMPSHRARVALAWDLPALLRL